MNSPPPSDPQHGGKNIANIGDGARVEQIALGSNITQIKGYTAEQVSVLLAEISSSYQPKPYDGTSPYVGLASFQEQDAGRFFGREKLTRDLVARVATSRFLVIAGPSGSGKSSLARAGLIPALKHGALPNSEHWLYENLAPERHPLVELGRAVAALTGKLNAGDDIRQKGGSDPTLLHRWAEIALGDQSTRRAILFVDQFEETFTQVADESERAAFFDLLTYAATVENGRVTILCATRSDFIGSWAAYPNLNAQLAHGVIQIPPMQDDELVSAIARPALQAGLRIDPDLVKQILDDMRDAPGALPLMQFALQDLFENSKQRGGVIALTRDDYLARGGLQKALARHADAEFANLTPAEQEIARMVFAGLIEPGRGTADTKRTAWVQELVPAGSDPAQARKVIAKLADARLVTTDQQDQHETVTLAHERLIGAWGWLRRLVDENRETIALQNQIAEDAQAWQSHNGDASYLYTGARLATAQEQLGAKKIQLSALADKFVDESIAARARALKREQRRTRRLLIAFGAAAVVFAVLALIALLLQQRAVRSEQNESIARQTAEAERLNAEQAEVDALAAADAAATAAREAEGQKILAKAAQATAVAQAKISRSRELAALALAQFDANPDRAVLIAVEANQEPNTTTFESEDALRQLLSQFPLDAVLRGHEDSVRSARFSPDGTKVVTASEDRTARVWDAASGTQLALLRGHGHTVRSARFSPDGTKVVTASEDNTARIWDAATGRELATLRGHADRVLTAAFSPNGRQIVTASDDRTARIYLTNAVDLAHLAEKRIGRELTCEERVQFLREEIVCPTPTPESSSTP